MPTKKIADINPCKFRPCTHPEHNPPTMMVFQPGEYEHECPACGHTVRFTVYPTHFLGPYPREDWRLSWGPNRRNMLDHSTCE